MAIPLVEAPILVTGPTGNVGREVVRALLDRGARVRVGVRNESEVRARFGDAVEYVPLDFQWPETFERAVRGTRGLFLLRPPQISNVRPTLNALVDRAVHAGVEHVVFLSVAGAEKNRLVPHRAVEEHLRESRIAWTILRPGFFAQNFGDAYRDDIRIRNEVLVPAGSASVAFIDVRDVAEIAASAFQNRAHRYRAYTLTGDETVTFHDAARMLTDVLKRRVRYVPVSIAAYISHLRRRAMPWGQVTVQTILHVGLRFGQARKVDRTLGTLLDRRPRRLMDYFRDHAALWA